MLEIYFKKTYAKHGIQKLLSWQVFRPKFWWVLVPTRGIETWERKLHKCLFNNFTPISPFKKFVSSTVSMGGNQGFWKNISRINSRFLGCSPTVHFRFIKHYCGAMSVFLLHQYMGFFKKKKNSNGGLQTFETWASLKKGRDHKMLVCKHLKHGIFFEERDRDASLRTFWTWRSMCGWSSVANKHALTSDH